jgi:hypothetical protein
MTKLVNILNRFRLLIYQSFNTRPLFSSFAVIAIFITVFLSLATPRFDTNDDVIMMLIANGNYYDKPSEHLIFTNVIIGLIIKYLYTFIPGIPWYPIYLYFFHFIACLLILYTLILSSKNIFLFKRILGFYTIFLFEIQMLMNLQFTSTSLFLGFSSILYFLFITKQKESSNWIPIIAGVLLGTAGMIRATSFWGILMFSIPLLLYGLKYLPRRNNFIFIVSALCIFLGSSIINNLYYQFSPAWKDYFEFNQVRGSLHGTPKLAWSDELPGILKKVNWSDNDYYIFESWFFNDSTTFSKDAIKTIDKLHNPKNKITYIWKIRASELIQFSQSVKGRIIYLLFILNVFFVLFSSNKVKYFTLLLSAWYLSICFYLLIYVRLPLRVFLPSFLFISLSLLIFSGNQFFPLLQNNLFPKIRHRIMVISFIVFLVVFAPVQEMLIESLNNSTNNQQLSSVFKTLKAVNSEGIFVVWGSSLKYEDVSPFARSKELPKIKLIGLGWMINSPPYVERLRQLDIDDLYQAIATRNDLYLIASDSLVSLYEQYMLEHYGKVVKLRSLLTIDEFDETRDEIDKIKLFKN